MHFFFELLLLAGLVALLIQLPAKFLAIALAIGAIVWFLLPGGPGGFHFGIGCDWLTMSCTTVSGTSVFRSTALVVY